MRHVLHCQACGRAQLPGFGQQCGLWGTRSPSILSLFWSPPWGSRAGTPRAGAQLRKAKGSSQVAKSRFFCLVSPSQAEEWGPPKGILGCFAAPLPLLKPRSFCPWPLEAPMPSTSLEPSLTCAGRDLVSPGQKPYPSPGLCLASLPS